MPGKWKAFQLHAMYSEHIRKLRILIQQLVKYERLLITPHRAKILKKEANLLIDYAKIDDPASRKEIMILLRNQLYLVPQLYDIAERYSGIRGDYVSIFPGPNRVNTNQKSAFIEYKGNPLPPLMPNLEEFEEMSKQKITGDITRIFWLPEFMPIPTYKHPDIEGNFY
ncbi:Ribosomal protein L17 [Oopsacas minuta]|uniref:Large ribosomal subunit protein bL17m n=1 Tax=Oopsacas minuta TaxID=111878 RepID=A0AAV7KKU1_9METZ|nr:Ribosomal protein L17 [Oopsacas minuta]